MLHLNDYESLSPSVRRFLWIVDRIGWLLCRPFFMRQRVSTSYPGTLKKILLLRCDGIGDLVLSTPAIRSLREHFPLAEMHLMVGEWSKDIAALIPGIDRLIIFAPWGYRHLRAAKSKATWINDLKVALSTRREKYDMVVDLRGDLLTILPMAFWGIPRRVARASRGGAFALTDMVPPPAKSRCHEVDRTLDVAAFLGAKSDDRHLDIKAPPEAIRHVFTLFADHSLNPARTILLSPGTQWRWRMWPIEKFSELVIKLQRWQLSVAVIGGIQDVSVADSILRYGELPGVNLAGKLSLVELLAAFRISAGFISVESGPAQLAVASGAYGVVLFGPGEQECFGPLSDRIGVIQYPCSLHPCYQRGDCRRPNDWCMDRISVEEVIMELTERLPILKELDNNDSPA